MNSATRILAVTLSVCLSLSVMADQTTAKAPKTGKQKEKPKPATLATKLAKIRAEFNKAQAEAIKPILAAKKESEREAAYVKYFDEFQRISTPLIKKALRLIEKSVKDPGAAEGLAWIVGVQPASNEAARAVQLLTKHYLTDDRTVRLASRFSRAPMAWTVPLIRKLIKEDLKKDTKARLLMGLARCLQTQASFPSLVKSLNAQRIKLIERQFGKKQFQALKTADAAKLEKEALQVYRQVIKQYNDVKSYGGKTMADRAKAGIFEIEHLSVGKVAPAIAGEDIDGVTFKLSDYRGKVVLLDFWGHW